ncbi:hypothetical protein Poly41_62440 [Novipirellula artificiosorum]|uniref:Uncharacterized protein n=1 Tax=Novipirellula artificiosorum TaxID=2528016 RepID=A0A5C6D5R6_9BACT|nr:hypothetical protein Poly41_62440 [Novipirellula artificiosorum]
MPRPATGWGKPEAIIDPKAIESRRLTPTVPQVGRPKIGAHHNGLFLSVLSKKSLEGDLHSKDWYFTGLDPIGSQIQKLVVAETASSPAR